MISYILLFCGHSVWLCDSFPVKKTEAQRSSVALLSLKSWSGIACGMWSNRTVAKKEFSWLSSSCANVLRSV